MAPTYPALESVSSDSSHSRLLNWRLVQHITGLSRTTAWRLAAKGEFPKPVSISKGRVAWHEAAIKQWVASRGSNSVEPGEVRL